MEENKTQSKQAEDESIFFRFGDDLAVDDNPHRALRIRREARRRNPNLPIIIGSPAKEIADGFVEDAGARPRRRRPAEKGKSAPGDPNPYAISR